jgi:hypothetical protein
LALNPNAEVFINSVGLFLLALINDFIYIILN